MDKELMDTNYLKKMIHDEAVSKFATKWMQFPEYSVGMSEVRQKYQKLLRTEEFKEFKKSQIKIYEKEITSNVLHSFKAVSQLVKEAGEE